MAPSPVSTATKTSSASPSPPTHTRYPYLPGHDPTAPPPGLFDSPFARESRDSRDSRDSHYSPGTDSDTTPRRPPRRRPVPFPDPRYHPRHREAPTAAECAERERRRTAQLAADLAPTGNHAQERATRAWLHSQHILLDAVPFEPEPRPETRIVRDPDELDMLRRLERRGGVDPRVDLETLELNPASEDEGDMLIRVRATSHGAHGHPRPGSIRRRPLMPLLRTRARANSDPLSPVGTPPPSYTCAMRDRAPAYPFPCAPYNPYETQETPGTPPMPLNLPEGWDAPGAYSPEGLGADRVPAYGEENRAERERRRGRSWGWKRRRRRPGAHSFMESVLAATT